MAGGVFRVDNPPFGMAALAGEIERAGGIAVKADVELVQQHFLYGRRSLAHEVLDRLRICAAIARLEDIARQRLRIRRRVVNDSALRPVAVGRQRAGQ